MSFEVLGLHIDAEFIGGLLLPGLVFLAVAVWPFIDYEPEPTHFTADPLDRPPWGEAAADDRAHVRDERTHGGILREGLALNEQQLCA
jgi:hypothetical protein